ncbi:zinc resistance-associated protein [Desulfomicrobium norvegicum]|uniref:Zinc resistance-associated protein n=1 Tax=Desulfomicrobium norvegicum (strain DSM 1741 / NCIMB 8310) TaxID=52561 RepID=A0A8G2C1F4_DESNO|nr:periplasmic heavy metal sensor [Desulfomicrobium norvegicum]SFL50696.1 zinc resistance-associated protein [Desulfomicrobium norvegicum]
MKTYRNTIATILTLAFVTAFAGLAAAQGHGMKGGMQHGTMGGMTPEKQAVMQKLHADYDAATADLRKQLFAKESELNAELYGERTDEKKVEALTNDINALNAKIFAERIRMHKVMAKEGIMPMGGKGMMGGMGDCPMMGGGMNHGKMGGGMQHGMMGGMMHGMPGNGTAGQAPVDHSAHGTPAQQ